MQKFLIAFFMLSTPYANAAEVCGKITKIESSSASNNTAEFETGEIVKFMGEEKPVLTTALANNLTVCIVSARVSLISK